MKESKSKAHELGIHLDVSVENATQWKQREKACAAKIQIKSLKIILEVHTFQLLF